MENEWIDQIILDLILASTNHPEIHTEGHLAIERSVEILERVKRLEEILEDPFYVCHHGPDAYWLLKYLRTGEE